MKITNEPVYNIPAKYRRIENMHVAFWLVKDISWCMIWRELGLAMFIPTLTIAIIIAWRTRQLKSELAHNLAITFWITANGYWMISEFFHFDELKIYGDWTGKHLALIPFIIGALILFYYYAVQRPREIREHKTTTL